MKRNKEHKQEQQMTREEMVIKFEPLINKLTAQFYHKTCCDWGSIKSMAYLGFTQAMNKYDSSRSNMSFMSFAAFEMRNTIMTCLTEESRVVKLPFAEQKSMKEAGLNTYNSISIDHKCNDDEGNPRETVMNMVEQAKFSDGDVFEYLYNRLENKFNTIDCQIFYMTFGLKGFEEMANKDIAKQFNLSEGRISQRKKEMIKYIRNDNDMCEMLASLTL